MTSDWKPHPSLEGAEYRKNGLWVARLIANGIEHFSDQYPAHMTEDEFLDRSARALKSSAEAMNARH